MQKPIHYATHRLRKYREERDWSQAQLAEFLSLQLNKSVTRSTVQKWEEGKRGIVAEQALEMSKILKIPVMELVARRDV